MLIVIFTLLSFAVNLHHSELTSACVCVCVGLFCMPFFGAGLKLFSPLFLSFVLSFQWDLSLSTFSVFGTKLCYVQVSPLSVCVCVGVCLRPTCIVTSPHRAVPCCHFVFNSTFLFPSFPPLLSHLFSPPALFLSPLTVCSGVVPQSCAVLIFLNPLPSPLVLLLWFLFLFL